MTMRGDIEFEIEGIKFSLVPLKQKKAGMVFHTALAQVVSALSGAFESDKNQLAGIAQALGTVDYEILWGLASTLCEGALVHGDEIKSLEDIEELSEKPWILYKIIYEGVRGNWPRVFFDLEAKIKGFVSKMQGLITDAPTS